MYSVVNALNVYLRKHRNGAFSQFFLIFTALHAMQTRSSDENSVRLSVRPSVCPSVCLCLSHACIVTKQ